MDFMRIRNITTAELEEKLATQPLTILDVRIKEMYEAGHIPGAVNIPYEIVQNGGYLPTAKPTYIVCQGSIESKLATTYLAKRGYDVVNVLRGMDYWHGPQKKGAQP